MSEISHLCLATIWQALGADASTLAAIQHIGTGDLPSCYAVTDFASGSIAAAALAVAELASHAGGQLSAVRVDRQLASMWFGWSIRPIGWQLPAAWDALAGDYRARDGWIRLHTNAPHHRLAALSVLGGHADRASLAKAVARWPANELEHAVINAGGCAAQMRTVAAWQAHPHGMAVNSEPLIHLSTTAPGPARDWQVSAARPLAGLRVLDLTRVLAGPVATRFLAGFGAEVLRIDAPGWDEPGVIPEVTLGKRCARLDLRTAADRATFEALLGSADLLLHGYRPGALDKLGYDAVTRQALAPGLIDVCLSAYGWSGPWQQRRGFDSLVQMSTGIAEAGMHWRQADQPVPLPVQALDHATGYMLAATAVRAVRQRLDTGCGTLARLSLARTAKLLGDLGSPAAQQALAVETPALQSPQIEETAWGAARRLLTPVAIDGIPMHWSLPASSLGSALPVWL